MYVSFRSAAYNRLTHNACTYILYYMLATIRSIVVYTHGFRNTYYSRLRVIGIGTREENYTNSHIYVARALKNKIKVITIKKIRRLFRPVYTPSYT